MKVTVGKPVLCLTLLLFVWGAVGIGSAVAAIYGRRDGRGCVHITDNPAAGTGYRILQTTLKRPVGFQQIVTTGGRYSALIKAAALATGLDDSLLRAVIRVESGFDAGAVSPRGARGLMQLMPAVAREYGVVDCFDPAANIRAGSRYLQSLKKRFVDLDKTLAAYNAGPGRVERYGGIPPFAETRNYIARVKWYRNYYSRHPELVTLAGAEKLFHKACRAFDEHRFRDSAALFSRVLNRYPDSAEAHYNLALVEARSGKIAAAVAGYGRALSRNPFFSEAYTNLAILYERINQIHNAVVTWRAALTCELSTARRRQIKQFIRELQELQKSR